MLSSGSAGRRHAAAHAAAAAVLVLALLGWWWWLGAPYRLFPSDDTVAYRQTQLPLFSEAPRPHMLATDILLRGVGRLCHRAGVDSPNTLLLFVLSGHAVTLALLLLGARRLSRRAWPALLAALLFGTSAWPATYAGFWTYAPWAAALGLATLMLTHQATCGTALRQCLLAFLAGSTWAIFLATTLSAVPFGLILLLGLLIWSWPLQRFSHALRLAGFGLAVALAWLALDAYYQGYLLAALRNHMLDNLHSEHAEHALLKFNTVPRPPAWAGLWILWTHGRVLTTGLVAATLAGAWRVASPRVRQRFGPLTALEKTALGLAVGIWLHLLIIDALPTTKLARTHFLAFPLICLFLSLAVQAAAARVKAGWKPGFTLLIAAATVGAAAEGLSAGRAMRQARQALPTFLAAQTPRPTVILLEEDPFRRAFHAWLSRDFAVRTVALADLRTALEHRPEPVVLVLGPLGPRSGNTAFLHGCLPDAQSDLRAVLPWEQLKIALLPTPAYWPRFCLEEEICQGLLYAGQIPDPAEDRLKNARAVLVPAGFAFPPVAAAPPKLSAK